MEKRGFPSIFNGAGDPFVNDCRKFTMQTEKYIDGGRGGHVELSNCSLHWVSPEVGLSSADLSAQHRPLMSDPSPSFLTFCHKLYLLGARIHSAEEKGN